MNPTDVIHAIRTSDAYISYIYLNGGCYQFHLVLKSLFPEATAHINATKDHIATQIGDVFYDITGQVTDTFTPLTPDERRMCEAWSFSRNYWLSRDCPHCDEPVPITPHPKELTR